MWIELHDTMPGHWKTEGLAKELEINQAHAAGILCCLWTWALNNAPDGDLTRLSEEKLARECYWTLGRPLLPALKACGFVDGDDKIHDWSDYTGRLMEKREANARRMRLARARQRQDALDALALEEMAVLRGEPQARAAHVREPCGNRAGLPYPTKPYRTQQNRTLPKRIPKYFLQTRPSGPLPSPTTPGNTPPGPGRRWPSGSPTPWSARAATARTCMTWCWTCCRAGCRPMPCWCAGA